jgi:hypothetical protein
MRNSKPGELGITGAGTFVTGVRAVRIPMKNGKVSQQNQLFLRERREFR